MFPNGHRLLFRRVLDCRRPRRPRLVPRPRRGADRGGRGVPRALGAVRAGGRGDRGRLEVAAASAAAPAAAAPAAEPPAGPPEVAPSAAEVADRRPRVSVATAVRAGAVEAAAEQL